MVLFNERNRRLYWYGQRASRVFDGEGHANHRRDFISPSYLQSSLLIIRASRIARGA